VGRSKREKGDVDRVGVDGEKRHFIFQKKVGHFRDVFPARGRKCRITSSYPRGKDAAFLPKEDRRRYWSGSWEEPCLVASREAREGKERGTPLRCTGEKKKWAEATGDPSSLGIRGGKERYISGGGKKRAFPPSEKRRSTPTTSKTGALLKRRILRNGAPSYVQKTLSLSRKREGRALV